MQTVQCPTCAHYIEDPEKMVCKAFPKGIPEKILTGAVDHTQPQLGDQGLRYEPVAGVVAEE